MVSCNSIYMYITVLSTSFQFQYARRIAKFLCVALVLPSVDLKLRNWGKIKLKDRYLKIKRHLSILTMNYAINFLNRED